ncbi:MAG: PAS domain-containing protein, partial [Novosphingobium sp.]
MSTAVRTALPEAHRLLASLPHAVVLLEPGLLIASVNPAGEQFFGQSLRRLAGRPLNDVMAFPDQRLLERLHDYETPVSAREVEVSLRKKGAGQASLISALLL